jgi:alpha-beta hydrolase superfamily lysophospholipase
VDKIALLNRDDQLQRERRLIDLTAGDGFLIHGLLTSVEYRNQNDLVSAPIVLHVHGVMGHFLARGSPRLLPPALVRHGINSFSINSRLAYMGQALGYGIFDDGVKDIDAAVDKIKSKGYRNVFVLGYSLGANLVAYYASQNKDPVIKGIILEGCSYSIPEAQEKRLTIWNSIPSYDEIYSKAKRVLSPNPYRSKNDMAFIIYRAWGPSLGSFDSEIYTYKTWWFMRSPEAHSAKTNEIISGIKVPVLFLQGVSDHLLESWELEKLAELVVEGGNSNVKFKFIENAKHDCMENPEETIDAIVSWIYSLEGEAKSGA